MRLKLEIRDKRRGHLHDLISLAQVLVPMFLGLLTWNLNSKKTKHDGLAEDNDRLVEENRRLTKLNAEKDKEIRGLLRDRSRNETRY